MIYRDHTAEWPDHVRLWRFLRFERAPLELRDIWQNTGVGITELQRLLRLWISRGLLNSNRNMKGLIMAETARRYRNPPIVHSPRPKGNTKPSLRFVKSGRRRAWTAMRIMKRFDIPMLIMTAEVNKASIGDYLRQLERAGYIERCEAAGQSEPQWRIVQDTGPKPPAMQRRRYGGQMMVELHDRNLDQTFTFPSGQWPKAPFFDRKN